MVHPLSSAPGLGPIPAQTLLDAPETRNALRDLFLTLYGLSIPRIELARVMHWAGTTNRLGVPVPTLDAAPTWLFGGHFYSSASPAPTDDEIETAFAEGHAAGAHAFLVPAVRAAADASLLARRGFVAIPWFIESVYERRLSYDADLRAQIGGDWYRGVLAVVRKAERFYDISYYNADDVRADPSILETVAHLHACNVRKYGHPLNFYSRTILDLLLRSSLGDKLLLCVRRDRETGEAVQTYISLIDRARSEMYLLVQGIDADLVRSGQNLYVDHAYQLLRYAEESGVRMVNFARGAQDQKRRLGANRFFLLENWLLHSGPDATDEIRRLALATRAMLHVDAEGRGVVGAVPLEPAAKNYSGDRP